MNWILICSIAGAVILIITAFLQANKEKHDNEDRLRDKSEIIELQKKNNENLEKANAELFNISKLQAELILKDKELQEANERIQLLNEETNDYLKGNNINCHIDFAPVESSNMKAFIVNEGKNPIYNLKVSFIDYKKLQRWNIRKLEDGNLLVDLDNIKSISKTIFVNEVSPQQTLFLDFEIEKQDYFNKDPYKLEVTFQSRENQNNYLLQQFIVADINNAWLQKSRMIRIINNKPHADKIINRVKADEEWHVNWAKEFDLPISRYYINFKGIE